VKKKKDELADSGGSQGLQETPVKNPSTKEGDGRTEEDLQKLIEELRLREIELERQNKELRQAQAKAETGLEEQADLYDSAPVGYFTLDRKGIILRANLAGAEMMGVEQSRLLQSQFGLFVSPETRPAFNVFLKDIVENRTKGTCELVVLTRSREAIHVLIEAAASNGGEECRIAVVDVTESRRAQQQEHSFYRKTIRSVTKGKLDLVSPSTVNGYLNTSELVLPIATPADTATARHSIVKFSASKGLGADLGLFEAAIGEAMNNVLKHATDGLIYAGVRGNCLWVAVSDSGPGISSLNLPGATSSTGSSSTALMGMGYAIMMAASDSIQLNTGSRGTTVVLSKNMAESESPVSLDQLLDTWDDIPD
jgi:PAS domain S-box-containing protein